MLLVGGSDDCAAASVADPVGPGAAIAVTTVGATVAEAGVYLIENMVMDGVLAAGASSFCFMLAPVKFKGATGCPVRPIAVV